MAGTATANATTDTLNERQLLAALRAVRKGDFIARLPSDLNEPSDVDALVRLVPRTLSTL